MLSMPENIRRNELLPLKHKKVVEHNDLITSVAKMDKVPLKIFELAVSHINVKNPPKDNIIIISKKSLFAFFKVSDNDKHHRFKEAIERMQKQAYFVIKQEDANQGAYFESIVPIPYVRWNDYNDNVTIEFNHRIMPYLIDLKNNFTQYAILDVMNLNSKYSVILYKWLSMNYNQFDHYKDGNYRTKAQLESYQNPLITMTDLRHMTNTEKLYLDFRNFEKRVLKQAIQEISKETHFYVSYEKIKKERSVSAIKFFIKKKEVVPNSYYKDEQYDYVYLEEKAKREKYKKEVIESAQKNQLTQLLVQHKLIDFADIFDEEIMFSLGEKVYPKYDEFIALKGLEDLIKHLEYVKDKKEGYSKENKPKYLLVAITKYLSRFK